jgi:RimJ/RimL family protein N-acetyltransferase
LLRDGYITYAVVDAASNKAVGAASYLNINQTAGSIEVGGIAYSPKLQRKPAGTEAMFLMMRRAFDELAYRRYEWKCNALNARSRAAALRYGFRFEGIFRQADVYQGPQPRHRLALDHRLRMAGGKTGLRALARSGEFRRRRQSAPQPVGADACRIAPMLTRAE